MTVTSSGSLTLIYHFTEVRYTVHIESREDNGATQDQGGLIRVYPTSQCSGVAAWVITPPKDPEIAGGSYCIRFFYDTGYSFVRWDSGGGVAVGTPAGDEFGSAVMTVTSTGSLTLIYHSIGTRLSEAADLVVWRPSSGTWYVRHQDGSSWQQQWGLKDDVPLLGDVDGDGVRDLIVWRPSSGTWVILKSTAGYAGWNTPSSWTVTQWGLKDDKPLTVN
jgi:hypothetical protein